MTRIQEWFWLRILDAGSSLLSAASKRLDVNEYTEPQETGPSDYDYGYDDGYAAAARKHEDRMMQ